MYQVLEFAKKNQLKLVFCGGPTSLKKNSRAISAKRWLLVNQPVNLTFLPEVLLEGRSSTVLESLVFGYQKSQKNHLESPAYVFCDTNSQLKVKIYLSLLMLKGLCKDTPKVIAISRLDSSWKSNWYWQSTFEVFVEIPKLFLMHF
ncbi:MAG: hypothetical protein HC932_06115 [Thermales bacterium]|nr:hypothetical protein [Thermales bacterium]